MYVRVVVILPGKIRSRRRGGGYWHGPRDVMTRTLVILLCPRAPRYYVRSVFGECAAQQCPPITAISPRCVWKINAPAIKRNGISSTRGVNGNRKQTNNDCSRQSAVNLQRRSSRGHPEPRAHPRQFHLSARPRVSVRGTFGIRQPYISRQITIRIYYWKLSNRPVGSTAATETTTVYRQTKKKNSSTVVIAISGTGIGAARHKITYDCTT